jgi:hypothetical protein
MQDVARVFEVEPLASHGGVSVWQALGRFRGNVRAVFED